jgi:hypothetical protein
MSDVSEKETGVREGEAVVIRSPTVWDAIDKIMSDVPEDVLSRLPADGAERHDRYLRGTHTESRQES